MPLREINGMRLLVEESGRGDPLVLVHGSWDDLRAWEFVDADLARRFTVISYTRRGHSGSEDGVEEDSRHDDEDDLASLMETLELAPANVVGNSFGSSIILGLAARRPELFRSICVHEPPLLSLADDGDPGVAQVGEAVARALDLIEREEATAAARDFVESVALGPGGWETLPEEERASIVANADTFAHEQRDPGWAEIDLDGLGDLEVPVALTKGDQSPPFFSTIVARLAESLDNAEVTTLPGVGHLPHVTHPADYEAFISGFAPR